MYGLRAPATSSRNRRSPLKAKCMNSISKFIRIGLLGCFALFPLSSANSAFGQAPKGPVRITLDEAIRMALQHNHNMIAARTAIDQSLALEVTANLRPNPALFADWEYLPLGAPSSQNPNLYPGVS